MDIRHRECSASRLILRCRNQADVDRCRSSSTGTTSPTYSPLKSRPLRPWQLAQYCAIKFFALRAELRIDRERIFRRFLRQAAIARLAPLTSDRSWAETCRCRMRRSCCAPPSCCCCRPSARACRAPCAGLAARSMANRRARPARASPVSPAEIRASVFAGLKVSVRPGPASGSHSTKRKWPFNMSSRSRMNGMA